MGRSYPAPTPNRMEYPAAISFAGDVSVPSESVRTGGASASRPMLVQNLESSPIGLACERKTDW